jgi:hypothetical protein
VTSTDATKHVAKKRPEKSRDTRLRFEQWAKNPGCEANTLSAVHNVKMAKVAAHAGLTPTFGASAFALARGEQFEFNLLRDEAARLLPALIETASCPRDPLASRTSASA